MSKIDGKISHINAEQKDQNTLAQNHQEYRAELTDAKIIAQFHLCYQDHFKRYENLFTTKEETRDYWKILKEENPTVDIYSNIITLYQELKGRQYVFRFAAGRYQDWEIEGIPEVMCYNEGEKVEMLRYDTLEWKDLKNNSLFALGYECELFKQMADKDVPISDKLLKAAQDAKEELKAILGDVTSL